MVGFSLKFRSLLFGIFIIFFLSCESNKIAYVDIQKVFNDFKLKEDLSKDFHKVKNDRDKVVDSLKLDLNKHYSIIENSNKNERENLVLSFKKKEQVFYEIVQDYKSKNDELMSEYDAQIYSRINSLINKFGENNSYDLILGANNSGNIMYAKKGVDITEEVTDFLNREYEDE